MANFPYDHVITESLQTAAELIVKTRPVTERADWAAFLLNEMQAVLPEGDRDGLLEQVQERIAGRLETGSW